MTGPPLYPSSAQKLESPSACSFIYLSIYLSFYLSIRLLIYFQIFIHLCVDSLSINRFLYEVTGAPLYKRTPHPKRRLCRLVGHGAQPALPICQIAPLLGLQLYRDRFISRLITFWITHVQARENSYRRRRAATSCIANPACQLKTSMVTSELRQQWPVAHV